VRQSDVLIPLQVPDEVPELGLDEAAPLQVILGGSGARQEDQEVFVFVEEAGLLEESIPRQLAVHDLLGDGQSFVECFQHDPHRRVGHVESGILLRVRGSDYWH